MAVLNSVEPVVVASAEKEEFVATSWEGKEMDELLKDVKGKGEPSRLHVKSVGNFPRRKKELFKNLKDRITPSKNPESRVPSGQVQARKSEEDSNLEEEKRENRIS